MTIPLVPTPEMLDAGAKELVVNHHSVWPDAYNNEEQRIVKSLAEKVWRAMWTTALVDVLMECKNEE